MNNKWMSTMALVLILIAIAGAAAGNAVNCAFTTLISDSVKNLIFSNIKVSQ
jgi:hypothetical protein